MQTGPTTGRIVWEWHVWDHLIQDHDPAQSNYGVVAAHPELIDVNFPPFPPAGGAFNQIVSIDYDPGNSFEFDAAITGPAFGIVYGW